MSLSSDPLYLLACSAVGAQDKTALMRCVSDIHQTFGGAIDQDYFGLLLQEAENQHWDEGVVVLAQVCSVPKRCSLVFDAALQAKTNTVEALLGTDANEHVLQSALMGAAGGKNLDLVQRLIPLCPHVGKALPVATGVNAVDVVRVLLQSPNTAVDIADALSRATHLEYTDILSCLAARATPDDIHVCLLNAITENKPHSFNALLPHSEPRREESLALQMACVHQRTAMIDSLCPLSNVVEALQELENNMCSEDATRQLTQYLHAQNTKDVLHTALDGASGVRGCKAKM